jgi:hypothetical protein
VLTAAGTGDAVQNSGHADLVDLEDGSTAMVLLGVRPVGLTHAFSPLGRETFLTTVDWVDGWPRPNRIEPGEPAPIAVEHDFRSHRPLDDPEWIAVRRLPTEVARPDADGLLLLGSGQTLGDPRPCFVGQRQRHLTATVRAVLDVHEGSGGLAARNAEDNWYGIEAVVAGDRVAVTARAVVAGFDRTWEAQLPVGDVELTIEHEPPPSDFSAGAVGGDRIRLLARSVESAATPLLLAELDGRHWCFETAQAFTGRVLGVYAVDGRVVVRRFSYSGR